MNKEISIDDTRKRLLWRAMHRGIKEMDIIIGGYAQTHLDAMNTSDINKFEEILEIPDQDLLSYATEQVAVPAHLQCDLLTRILTFRPNIT